MIYYLISKNFVGFLQEVIKFNNFDYLIVGIGLNTNVCSTKQKLSID